MTSPDAGTPNDREHPPPGETPAGESSTTGGISVPEPPEVRNAWGAWPLIVIGVLVLCVVLFMVGRIWSW